MSRQPSSEKRRAILAGALKVFAHDGYTRASVDAIAAEAGASTRTIYNHFQDKAHLFHTVIEESAHRVAEAQIALVALHLGEVVDLEADLVAFGMAMAEPVAESADHFALVRQINAQAGHIPRCAIDAWQETGPLRVRRALAEHLRRVPQLRGADPLVLALHLLKLVSTTDPSYRARQPADVGAIVAAGVGCFLRGYSG
ncbi:TetR/AcrR family transcriptional regulator [Actinokineospora sp. G85]|uniref:TetR/AcrR family transcriptional regulator n=1 Tax=Actinokineospora sp. G85 TaxID=3406626 RepID=UPI003C730866